MALNNVCLVGRICNDLEEMKTQSGALITRLCIATDRKYQKADSEKKTDFIDCVAFNNTSTFLNRYFHKGDMIAVQGNIQTDNYTDKNGNKRKSVAVVIENVSFCGGKSENGSQGTQGAQNEQYTQGGMNINPDTSDFEEIVDDTDDGLPF